MITYPVRLGGRSLLVLLGAVLSGCLMLPYAQAEALNETALPALTGETLLIISGAIQRTNHGAAAHLDRAMIEQLPRHTLTTSTSVTDGVSRFEGPLMRDVLQYVGAQGSVVQARALNRYVVDIPIADFLEYDVMLAMVMDGKKLELTDKGPLWIVYPRDLSRKLQDIRYDYRWVWQLNHLDVR